MADQRSISRRGSAQNKNPESQERIIPIKIEGSENSEITSTSAENNKITESANKSNINTAMTTLSISPNETPDDDCFQSREFDDTPVEIPSNIVTSSNVPEKIIIVIDPSKDEHCTNFQLVNGQSYSPISMLKRAVEIFLHNKNYIDARHQFALVVLNENNARWIHDFTYFPKDIITSFKDIEDCDSEDIFDLTALFDIITKFVMTDDTNEDLLLLPSYVVRIVLLYGRSYSMPVLNESPEITKLLNSPYFAMDIVMTHETPSSANNCTKIFNTFQELNRTGMGYSFSVARNASDLHAAMAKLLSHPLQRLHQTG